MLGVNRAIFENTTQCMCHETSTCDRDVLNGCSLICNPSMMTVKERCYPVRLLLSTRIYVRLIKLHFCCYTLLGLGSKDMHLYLFTNMSRYSFESDHKCAKPQLIFNSICWSSCWRNPLFGIVADPRKINMEIRDSLMVRIRACRVRDRGSIPRRGDFLCLFLLEIQRQTD